MGEDHHLPEMQAVEGSDQVWRTPPAHRLVWDIGALFLLALFVALMLACSWSVMALLLVGC